MLTHFGIATATISYHEHSPPARRDELLAALALGDVALVTDAGTPGISDPGQELVRAAIDAGFAVTPIPGPSAVVAAVIASGLPSDTFTFAGFLPRKPTERRTALERLRGEPRTLVFYEAPHRLVACLDDLLAVLGDRRVVVARELTKLHEEWLRGTLDEVRRRVVAARPRGEYTLVVAGASEAGADVEEATRDLSAIARERLTALLAEGASTRDAAATVARETGLARRELYATALELGRG